MFLSTITPTGKPPPLAVRLEQALPFRRCVRGEDVLWGSPASQTIQKPQAQYHGEARSSGVVPCRVPSLNEECALMHPLQGASFLSTPLQGGILKPPALRVVGDFASLEAPWLSTLLCVASSSSSTRSQMVTPSDSVRTIRLSSVSCAMAIVSASPQPIRLSSCAFKALTRLSCTTKVKPSRSADNRAMSS